MLYLITGVVIATTMDIHDEESQDVDLIILDDSEQSVKGVGEEDRDLPHFQFMDGKGRLQNSIDGPREGFIALKITYMHVFKKQQEHARALQQKNQQLVAEIQQLKKQSDLSLSQEQVSRSPCDIEIQTELVDSCSDKENSDLQFQLALLRSGFVQVAKYLLKREPLSSLPKKILDNLKSLDCDSEQSEKEVDNLVKIMSGLGDDLSQLPTKDEASEIIQPPGNNSSFTAKESKDSSLQKWVAGCQTQSQCDQTQPQTCIDFECKTLQKPNAHKLVALDSETLQEEDMYGVEGNGRDLDLVPYNLMRLRRKLVKLQSFPAEYRTMIQHFNDNLEQQKTTPSFKGDPFSHQRKSSTAVRTEPNVSGDISSFINFHDIKVPPSDFSQALRNSDHLQDGQVLQEGYSNTSPVKLDSPKDTFPFELVRGPPNTTQFSPHCVNNLSKWLSSSAGHAIASVYQPPPIVTSNMVEKGNKEHHTFIPCTNEANHQIPNQLHRSNTRESIANPATNPRSCDTDDRRSKRFMESSPHGLFMPGSNNDELATAHDYRQDMSESNVTTCKMECPVCQKNFCQGTTEAEVNSHVNLHFDKTTLSDQGYDILNPS